MQYFNCNLKLPYIRVVGTGGGAKKKNDVWGMCNNEIELERRWKAILGMTPPSGNSSDRDNANLVVAGIPLYGMGPVEREFMRYNYNPHQ